MLDPYHPYRTAFGSSRALQPKPISGRCSMHCIKSLLVLAFPILVVACADNTPPESILIPYPVEATESTPSFHETSTAKGLDEEQKEHDEKRKTIIRS